MESSPLRTVALLAMGFVLTATPSFAQRERDGRREGDGRGWRQSVERAQPRRGGELRGRSEGRVERRGRSDTQGRIEPRVRADAPARIEPRGRQDSPGRLDIYRGRDDRAVARRPSYDPSLGPVGGDPQRYRDRDRVYDNRSYDRRSYDRRNIYPSYGYGYGGRRDDRSYRHRGRSYGYRPHVRTYVLPYGYRPYGYRPGWSLNLYFGRPYYGYGAYGYPSYGYPTAGYGYYSFIPGRAYGALRIVDVPRDAHVFVDGYYAGIVDDYDGVFQHLNLEVGPHHIEIEVPGYPPIAFEVRIEPGQTITYRANLGY